MNPKKVYTIDSAFMFRIGFNFTENKGRVLENMAYVELRRRSKEVYYFLGKNECDFLVKEGLSIVQAIQVVYLLDHTNCEREFKGLQEAMTTYNLKNGLLLVYNFEESLVKVPEEITIVPIWKWFLTASIEKE